MKMDKVSGVQIDDGRFDVIVGCSGFQSINRHSSGKLW